MGNFARWKGVLDFIGPQEIRCDKECLATIEGYFKMSVCRHKTKTGVSCGRAMLERRLVVVWVVASSTSYLKSSTMLLLDFAGINLCYLLSLHF